MNRNSILTDRQTTLGIIIPVYDGEKYLKEAIESVLSQPCKDLKLVVVNDGSKDNSSFIAQYYANLDARVVIINQANQGVAVARNKGIQYCLEIGVKYIAFLDADDVWISNFYSEELKKTLIVHEKDAYRFRWYDGNETLTRGRKHALSGGIERGKHITRFGVHFCSYIYRVDVLVNFKICFPPKMKVQEDCVFEYLFLSVAESVECLEKDIFIYRSNSNSVLHSKHNAGDWYFSHIIPSWIWAKKELIRINEEGIVEKKDIEQCDIMQKTYLSEFIEVASQQGILPSVIKKIIEDSNLSYLYESNIWVDEHSKQRWDKFNKKPRLTWAYYRITGIIYLLSKKMRDFKIVQKRRYPINIENLH